MPAGEDGEPELRHLADALDPVDPLQVLGEVHVGEAVVLDGERRHRLVVPKAVPVALFRRDKRAEGDPWKEEREEDRAHDRRASVP